MPSGVVTISVDVAARKGAPGRPPTNSVRLSACQEDETTSWYWSDKLSAGGETAFDHDACVREVVEAVLLEEGERFGALGTGLKPDVVETELETSL